MSTGYGIAAVTAVLRARLENRLLDADVQAAIGPTSVTSLPPDQVQAGAAEPNQLNIFLHHAAPNASWRNEGHPVHDANGRRVTRPPLALDLHYLVTAFGVDTYAGEILLGHAMGEFHEHPLLDRESIDHVLHPAVADPSLPAAVSASGLEEQPEPVRIVPIAVNSEEMSRLWTALQAQYRATAAFLVGTVLIEPTESAAAGLPVLHRGLGPETLTAMAVVDVVVEPAANGPWIRSRRSCRRAGSCTRARVGDRRRCTRRRRGAGSRRRAGRRRRRRPGDGRQPASRPGRGGGERPASCRDRAPSSPESAQRRHSPESGPP